jgi:uncharacterized protein (TIGR02996 family)
MNYADPRVADLFAAILAAPEDDGPRSVLADYLIAQGDPRGEVIQLQLAGHEPPYTVEIAGRECVMRRGFVDELTVRTSISDLIAMLDDREAHTTSKLDLRSFAIDVANARQLALELAGRLACVRSLRIMHASLDGTCVEALLSASPKLVLLDLEDNEIGDRGARAIAELAPETLVTLDLAYNRIDEHGIMALAKSPRLDNLENLILEGCLGMIPVKALLAGWRLPKLRKLDLGGCRLGPMAGILTHARFENLSDLDLSNNDIGDNGLVSLVRGHWSQNLVDLDLQRNGITDDSIDFMCKYAHDFPSLRNLWLGLNNVSARALERLRETFPEVAISA